jgi:DNA ligase (NAD+)
MNLSLKELQEKIDQADIDYYTLGKSRVDDSVYDKWRDALSKLSPNDIRVARVGASVRDTILSKVKHCIPMGSQFKAMNEAEYRKWINTAGRDLVYHASHKMDGGSFSFEYQEGRLISAVSRGDGLEGEDVTANALKFQGLPKIVTTGRLCRSFTGFVRGEVVLRLEDWRRVDPDQTSNPRNMSIGIARRKSGQDSELLTVYAFNIFDMAGQCLSDTEESAFALLRGWGFTTVPYFVGTADAVWLWFNSVKEERPALSYWIDGIIVRANSLSVQQELGVTDNRPKGQIAVKFEAEGAETVLRQVELSVGHTGAIIPTAIFDPVRVGGTTVSRATLCNWENINTLGVGVGDKVRVVKAGDIIPQITEVVEKNFRGNIPEPTQCPSCAGPVRRQLNTGGDDTTAIYCQNPNCPGKLFGKIERFIQSLNILGGGEELIQALITDLNVVDAADLYSLKNRRDALVNLKLNGKTRLGEKRADRFLAEIEKVRKLTLSAFLGSLGIAGLGKRRVALMQAAVGGKLDTLEDWFSGKLLDMAQEAGVPGMAERIQKDLQANRSLIEKFKTEGVMIVKDAKSEPIKAGACVICITGALSKPKAYFWDLIQKAGHVATDDFSKSVTHLVAADSSGTSGKLQKARKAGIPIWSEADLMKLVGSGE